MPKKIIFTIEVEDDFDSFDDLERFVNHEGQKLKKELCEKVASEHASLDSPSCPKCGHAESIAKGHKERKLKTIFGDISIQQPRRQCQKCNSYFFPMGAWLSDSGNVTPQLKEVAILCAASWPYEVASSTLQRLTRASVCAKEIQLLTEAVHEVTARSQIDQEVKEDETEGFIEALSTVTKAAIKADSDALSSMEQLDHTYPPAEGTYEHKRVYLGFDGIYVHGWDSQYGIEGKVGIIFSGDEDDKTQISKGRNVLLKKEYLASFETSETLAQKAYAVVWNNGFLAPEMIVLGDGARWIRKMRDNYFSMGRGAGHPNSSPVVGVQPRFSGWLGALSYAGLQSMSIGNSVKEDMFDAIIRIPGRTTPEFQRACFQSPVNGLILV